MDEIEKCYVLVYQVGLANVFEVDCLNMSNFGRNAKRVLQSDFRACENFARGLAYAGKVVVSAHCNMAGDIINAKWDDYMPDAIFFEKLNPVYSTHI